MISFSPALLEGTLIKRYKRFFADLCLENGEIITAHCPNTGSMKTAFEPNWKAAVSRSENPKRKLAYTLELVYNGTCWICVNTHRANPLIRQALLEKRLKSLRSYEKVQAEYRFEDSRIDFFLEKKEGTPCLLEVKTVSFVQGKHYLFPDSPTVRGQKHLQSLISAHEKGMRACLLFLVLRKDADSFRPAKEIDPIYAKMLLEAQKKGVEILAYGSDICTKKMQVTSEIPLCF